MTLGTTVRAVAAAATLVAASLTGLSQTALAGTSDCPSSSFCLWQDSSYNGLIWNRSGTTGWLNFASSINDTATSGYNKRGSLDSSANNDSYGAGASFCFNGNTASANVGSGWNDNFSSARNYSSSAVC